jgi:hypothetical protein
MILAIIIIYTVVVLIRAHTHVPPEVQAMRERIARDAARANSGQR